MYKLVKTSLGRNVALIPTNQVCIYSLLTQNLVTSYCPFPGIYLQHMCRVKTACKELEAVTKLKSLENCIGGLTPEWLKSLILDAPDLSVATTNIVEIARKNPDYCLAVLQV